MWSLNSCLCSEMRPQMTAEIHVCRYSHASWFHSTWKKRCPFSHGCSCSKTLVQFLTVLPRLKGISKSLLKKLNTRHCYPEWYYNPTKNMIEKKKEERDYVSPPWKVSFLKKVLQYFPHKLCIWWYKIKTGLNLTDTN